MADNDNRNTVKILIQAQAQLAQAQKEISSFLSQTGQAASSAGAGAKTFSTGAEAARRSAVGLGSASANATSNIKGMVGGFIAAQLGVQAITGAFRTMKAFVSESVKAFAEQEAAVRKMTAALETQGRATPANVKAMTDLAAAYQKTTVFGDELLLESEALLIQLGGVGPDMMGKALRATTDLASGLNIDLKAATLLVGKAFAGETGTLSRYGIVLDQNRVKVEGMTYVLGQLDAKFGGQAQAQIETYAGRTAQLANTWGDFKERVGEAIVQNPFLIAALDAASSAVDGLNASVESGIPAWQTFSTHVFGPTSTAFLVFAGNVLDADRRIRATIESARNTETPFKKMAAAVEGSVPEEAKRRVEDLLALWMEDEKAVDANTAALKKLREEAEKLADKFSDKALAGNVRRLNEALKILEQDGGASERELRLIGEEAAKLFDAGARLDPTLLDLALSSEKLGFNLSTITKPGLDAFTVGANDAIARSLALHATQQELSALVASGGDDWVVYGGKLMSVGESYDIVGVHAKAFTHTAAIDITRLGQMLTTAMNGTFAQMLLGAKGFQDGFVDIWRSIKGFFANIVAQMAQQFLGGFVSKIAGSLGGLLGGGGGVGGSISSGLGLAGLFGGGAGAALPGVAIGLPAGLGAGGAASGAGMAGLFGLSGAATLGIGAAVAAGIWGIPKLIGQFRGGEEGTQVNPARDAFLAQFGAGGTGAGSGFGTLAAKLTAITGEAGGGRRFTALTDAKTMDQFNAAVARIVQTLADAETKTTDLEAATASQQEAMRAEYDQTKGKIQEQIAGIDQQMTSLQQSIAGEAPEAVMGVIEAAARAQLEGLTRERDALQTHLADVTAQEQAALARVGDEAIRTVDRIMDAFTDVQLPDLHGRIVYDTQYDRGYFPGGVPEPLPMPGAAAGGLFSRPSVRVIAEREPEVVGSPNAIVDAFAAALRQTGAAAIGGAGPASRTLVIQTIDAASFRDFLRRGGGEEILEHFDGNVRGSRTKLRQIAGVA